MCSDCPTVAPVLSLAASPLGRIDAYISSMSGYSLSALTHVGISFSSWSHRYSISLSFECRPSSTLSLVDRMVVPFGFSVGDFINAIGLVNKVRQALKDVGGAGDDIQLVLHDLQHLELILIQLKDGEWGAGGDVSHVNAIRGIALSCGSVLEGFLRKVESFQRSASCEPGLSNRAFTRGFKNVQWAISMKEEVDQFRLFVVSKVVTMNLLLSMPLG